MGRKGKRAKRRVTHKRPPNTKHTQELHAQHQSSTSRVLRPLQTKHARNEGYFQRFWRSLSDSEKIAFTVFMLTIGSGVLYVAYRYSADMSPGRGTGAATAKRPSICIPPEARPDLHQVMASLSVTRHKKVPKKFETKVRKAVAQVSHNDRLKLATIDPSTNFSIEIDDWPEADSEAAFDPQTNRMIVYHSDDTRHGNEAFLQEVIVNELHHASIQFSNHQKHNKAVFSLGEGKRGFNRDMQPAMPFLNDNADIDEKLLIDLSAAISDTKAQVNHYHKLFMKQTQGEDLSDDDRQHLDQFMACIQYYQPVTHFIRSDAMRAFKHRGVLKKSNLPGIKYEVDTAHLGFPKPAGIMYIKTTPTKGQYQFTFAKDDTVQARAEGFFGDWQGELILLQSNPVYRALPRGMKDAEILSSIDSEWTSELKQLLAPKVCDYLNNYHQVVDYCAPCP